MRTSRGKAERFSDGLRDGLPIGLGYFPVSFGFGIAAVAGGADALTALLISMTNLTSAGQVAGLSVMFALGSLGEMALTQLVINLRYALMSLSLSQKLSPGFGAGRRMLASAFVTDEIYAVASSREGEIQPQYWAGLALLPYIGWSLGTLCGAVAGGILPGRAGDALGIAIYGMFIAIILPPMRESRAVLFTVSAAAAVSCLFFYTPVAATLGSGFCVIIASVAAAALLAWLCPLEKDAEAGRGEEKKC